MNLEHQKEIISQMSITVLEETAFIFSDELEEEDRQEVNVNQWAPNGYVVNFTGEHAGSIHFWGDKDFAKLIAVNMLGYSEDEEIPDKVIDDSLKELTNVLTGNMLTSLFGEEPLFDLSVPEKISHDTIDQDINKPSSVWLNADEHTVLISLSVEK